MRPSIRHSGATFALLSILATTLVGAEKKPAAPAQKAPAKAAAKATPAPRPTPRNTDAQRLHSEALGLFQSGDMPGALAAYRQVVELEPGNAPALINLALVEQRLKLFTEAEQHLLRVIKDDPKSGAAWLILGISAYEQDKLEAALAHLAQAVLHSPKSAQAHQYFGVVLGKKGWYSVGSPGTELEFAL